MRDTDLKAIRRLATRQWLEDQENVDGLLERLAEGDSLRDVCKEYDLVYPSTMRYLARHHSEEYEAAKLVRADSALDEMADVEKKLEEGDLDFNTARELMKSKQWRAERLNSGRYGQKQQVDMRVTDTTKLHMDMLRTLARRPVTQVSLKRDAASLAAPGEPSEPIDASFTVVPEPAKG
jgi:hypothetical protein